MENYFRCFQDTEYGRFSTINLVAGRCFKWKDQIGIRHPSGMNCDRAGRSVVSRPGITIQPCESLKSQRCFLGESFQLAISNILQPARRNDGSGS